MKKINKVFLRLFLLFFLYIINFSQIENGYQLFRCFSKLMTKVLNTRKREKVLLDTLFRYMYNSFNETFQLPFYYSLTLKLYPMMCTQVYRYII
jgi:hypothetical protein